MHFANALVWEIAGPTGPCATPMLYEPQCRYVSGSRNFFQFFNVVKVPCMYAVQLIATAYSASIRHVLQLRKPLRVYQYGTSACIDSLSGGLHSVSAF